MKKYTKTPLRKKRVRFMKYYSVYDNKNMTYFCEECKTKVHVKIGCKGIIWCALCNGKIREPDLKTN